MPWQDEFSLKNFRRFVVGVDQKVPILNGTKRKYVNFDNAATTPTVYPVLEEVNRFAEWYSSVHRGSGYKSRLSTDVYEEAHEVIGKFIGADLDLNSIIFVKNTTEAINKLANRLNLTKNDIVLCTMMEHHSNDLPWRKAAQVIHVMVDKQGILDLEDLKRKFRLFAPKIRLLAVSGASNVTGYVNNVYKIAEIAHSYGVPILVDGAQLVPHRPVDMLPQDHPCHLDFLAFSGHKMYAPFGAGVLVGPRKIFSHGCPDLVGGGTVDIVTTTDVLWAQPPEREEAGSPNVIGAVALAKAVCLLNKVGMTNAAQYEHSLTTYAYNSLKKIPGIILYGADPAVQDRVGVITFNIGGIPHGLLAAALSFEYGIGVRNGCFCAHPYIQFLLGLSKERIWEIQNEIFSGDRSNVPGMVRISFALYNNHQEIDYFLNCLSSLASSAKKLFKRYNLNRESGCYTPSNYYK